MSDAQEATNRFLADTAGRMVELGLRSEDGCKFIAYTLGSTLDLLADTGRDDPGFELASELILDIVKTMTYVQIIKAHGPEDIEAEAMKFRSMLDLADNLGDNDNEEDNNHG